MTFKHEVVVLEVGEERTSARGNSYIPAKLEVPGSNGKWPETYSVAAMGNAGAALQEANIGDTVIATFEVRQFKKEISLQLRNIEPSGNPFGE